MSQPVDDEPMSAAIPADVEAPDKVAFGMTSRQLGLLGATAFLAFWIFTTAGQWLPLPATLATIAPVLLAGTALAIGTRDGMPADRFLAVWAAHIRAPKTRINGPLSRPPGWCRVRGALPAPLALPVRAIRDNGVLDLADGGTAVIVAAGTVSFDLRSNSERASLVAGFGRWLNSLDASVQILTQARPVDLTPLAERTTAHTATLPAQVADYADDHAAFLLGLEGVHNLLERRVLVVLTDTASPGGGRRRREVSAETSLRRASETTEALRPLGITARLLDGQEAGRVLAESFTPADAYPAGLTDPDEVITRAALDDEEEM